MESINEKMDAQLRTRVDELTRANDENQDGRLDAADLKAQLNRIEAQLELQDQQNRGIIANQHKRMILSVVLVAVILVVLAFFGWRINVAYNNVMAACDRVNALADTVQTSLDTLDQSQLDDMMQDLPEITEQLKKIDVDALNKVLTELPALMNTVSSLQSQVESITNWFNGLGSVFAASVRAAVVVRQPRGAVLGIDRAAAHKAGCRERALHVDVVGVGIGPQRQPLLQAPVNAEPPDAAHPPCRCQSVDRGIGDGLRPGAVLDLAVGGVLTGNQAEHGLYLSRPRDDMADPPVDLCRQACGTGVAGRPLGRVAVGLHKTAGVLIDRQQRRQIAPHGLANGKCHSRSLLYYKIIPGQYSTISRLCPPQGAYAGRVCRDFPLHHSRGCATLYLQKLEVSNFYNKRM